MTTSCFINPNARLSSLIRGNSVASGFIMAEKNRIGGKERRRRSPLRSSINNLSITSWIDIARRRSKPFCFCKSGFSGIGNWMADEILWRAKALPSKRTGKLTRRERAAIFRATNFVARRSLETLGRDFSDPPRNWLIHQKWKRDGVCPRHRTPLRHAMIGGRTTAWCPRCQK